MILLTRRLRMGGEVEYTDIGPDDPYLLVSLDEQPGTPVAPYASAWIEPDEARILGQALLNWAAGFPAGRSSEDAA